MMHRWTWMALLVFTTGCLDLDGFVYNPVHCSNVGTETCEDKGAWDRICVPCEEPYDWGLDYPWFDGQLEPGQTVRPISSADVVHESVATDDGEGTLDLYFIPSHGADAEWATVTVIYNHGNYAGIEHYIPRIRILHELGVNVVVWDYRGYGKSLPDTPAPSEIFLADARQIREHAESYAPDPDRIVVYANSLGAIPSIEMALHQAPCALFLEAPFTSLQQISAANAGVALPEGFLSQARYDNTDKIRDYQAPLLIMHGTRDNKFSVDDVREMFDNAGSTEKELWLLPGVKHGIANIGVPEAGLTEYFDRMRGFLDTHAPACLGP